MVTTRCAIVLRRGVAVLTLVLMAGCHSPHDVTRSIQRIDLGGGVGPEDIAFDRAGAIFTGVADGRILRVSIDGGVTAIADTTGRPQGIALRPSGEMIVTDAQRGLLAIDVQGRVRTLRGRQGTLQLNFPNGVAVSDTGIIYFTDSSTRYDIHDMPLAALTADASGRLIEHDPATGDTRVLLSDLVFANGVALSPDAAELYVAETFAYRIRRYFLTGPRKGESDVLGDDLPGFPDNLHVDERGRLWVALYSERVRSLEMIQQVGFLPRLLSPALAPAVRWMAGEPPRVSRVLVLDAAGDLLHQYELGRGAKAYAPLTAAVPHRGRLYLGSSREGSIGVVPLE